MKKKVQVVILSPSEKNPDHIEALLFKTTKERGSFWQNVTGSVEDGESFEDAAKRELIEETGAKKDVAENRISFLETEFYFTDRKKRNVQERVYYYFGPKWEIQLCPEHVEYNWLPVDKIDGRRYKYLSNYQALLKTLENIKEKKERTRSRKEKK